MTNYDAVRGEISPYTADRVVIEKALLDNSLNPDATYSIRSAIALVAIKILSSFLALKGESEGGFSVSYDKEGLKAKIQSLATSNDISDDVSGVTTVYDGSKLW